MNKSTTTIRIYKESHKKLSSFLQANGLKSVRAVSTVLTRVIEENPKLFMPESMNKHNEISSGRNILRDEDNL